MKISQIKMNNDKKTITGKKIFLIEITKLKNCHNNNKKAKNIKINMKNWYFDK